MQSHRLPLATSGSPPLTRGAPGLWVWGLSPDRITPAYAGSTSSRSVSRSRSRDHPRLRGEHVRPASTNSKPTGSPPLTRGARVQDPLGVGPRGITPAYAGSTTFGRTGARSSPDHPRLRGEHAASRYAKAPRWGSPPLTRGAPDWQCPRGLAPRITPAYAGSTSRGRRGVARARDHPRLRGEHRTQ